jgi:hypothetical protein
VAFLLYDSRSGSTLLAALLNRHAGVSVSLESAYVSRLLEYPRPWGSEAMIPGLCAYLFDEVQFRELGLGLHEVQGALVRGRGWSSPGAAAVAVTDAYFARHAPAAQVCVIKHPPWLHLQAVESIFPDTQFIHLVRDGRAVYNSKRKTRSLDGRTMERNPVKAARDWRWRVQIAAACGSILHLRYEDLVNDPEREISRLLDFLRLEGSARAVVRPKSAYSSAIGAQQQALHANLRREPDARLAEQWREELSPLEIAVFECLCAPELERHTYRLTTPSLGPGWLRPVTVGTAVSYFSFRLAAGKGFRLIRRLRRGERLGEILRRLLSRMGSGVKNA